MSNQPGNNSLLDRITSLEFATEQITSEEIENKKKLIETLTWLIVIECVYSYYLDYNPTLLILRAIQLYAFMRAKFFYAKHIILISLTANIPVFLTHLLYHDPQPSIVIEYFINNRNYPYYFIFLVDFVIFILQILMITAKFEIHEQESEDEQQEEEEEEQEEQEENAYQIV